MQQLTITTPAIITLEMAGQFTPEVERLRRDSYPPTDRITSEDEFDKVSRHFVARVDGRLIGTVRVTHTPPSPEFAWAIDPARVPTGPGYVELTRGCVDGSARGLSVYRLMMTELICHLTASGVTAAAAVIEPDFPAQSVLWDLGFERWGPVTPGRHPEKGVCPTQYILHRLASSGVDLRGQLESLHEALRERGITVHSRLGAA